MSTDHNPIPPVTREDPAAHSGDAVKENVAALKALFPSIVTDGKVDWDVLRQLLGDEVEDGAERYGLNWKGKARARAFALAPSLGTLRPAKKDSKDWDTTKNIMIEGDNLEVLKLLRKSYAGKVKLIYIDPPYNTGKDFVYPDNYTESLANYEALTGQRGVDGARLTSNKETSGRYHTDWLNMMYPRLMLAKELLDEDGLICISHDDHERGNVANLIETVFGPQSEVACLIWDKQHSQQQGAFKRYHEYISIAARTEEGFQAIEGGDGLIEAGAIKKISKANPASSFTFPAGVRFAAPDGTRLSGTYGQSEKMTVLDGVLEAKGGLTTQPVTISAGWTQKNQMKSWFSGGDTFDTRGQKVREFFFSSTGKLKSIKERGRITPPTLLPKYGMVSEQTAALSTLMGESVFDTPKPLGMISQFIAWFSGGSDIVLDFFAGSGTTAHAVMTQNAADGADRRFIVVQLPEPLDKQRDEQKLGADFCDRLGKPRNIAELTKERLRRAGDKVKADHPKANLDTGFRAYTLATSNLKPWQPGADLKIDLAEAADNLVKGRSEDDLLVELLLKTGIDLALPGETREIAGRTVHMFGGGTLVVCLADIPAAEARTLGDGIADWLHEVDPPAPTTFFFKDSGFDAGGSRSAEARANLASTLRQRLGEDAIEKLGAI